MRSLVLLLALLVSPQASARSSESAVKVDVDLVLVNAAVTDSDGRAVTGLDKTHFQLWEDKVQQDIQYVSTEQVPVSMAVVFDISGSMSDKQPIAREAVAKYIGSGRIV